MQRRRMVQEQAGCREGREWHRQNCIQKELEEIEYRKEVLMSPL